MEKTIVLDNVKSNYNFGELPQGTFFHARNMLYLKIENLVDLETIVNAIEIETGEGFLFCELDTVLPVKKITVTE